MKQGSTTTALPMPENITGDVALFLDLDGTLASIAARPGDVGPDPDRNALLARLEQRLGGRLAVVSGRSITDIDRILDSSVKAVAGVHGLERRSTAGDVVSAPVNPSLEDVRATFGALADTQAGLIMEDKGSSITLHYRGVPDAEAAIQELGQHLADVTGLVLQKGNMVVELRTPGPNKGDAIHSFMSEPPFAGCRPIFIGDDLTDEDGFAVVEQSGGMGILVGPYRETKASRGLADVRAVLHWLNSI